jgi:hypothetical protein
VGHTILAAVDSMIDAPRLTKLVLLQSAFPLKGSGRATGSASSRPIIGLGTTASKELLRVCRVSLAGLPPDAYTSSLPAERGTVVAFFCTVPLRSAKCEWNY